MEDVILRFHGRMARVSAGAASGVNFWVLGRTVASFELLESTCALADVITAIPSVLLRSWPILSCSVARSPSSLTQVPAVD